MNENGFAANLNEQMQFPAEGIFSKVLYKTESYHYTLMCLAGGTDIDTHTSSKNGCVQVLKGKGTFVLNEQEIAMEPGVFIYMPAGAPHSLKAEEDTAFLLCLHC
ncbi:MAG: cupin domain-containing protein [Candidatus Omnitrophica bacterium]|nr:cupin domain-containing protein [Candidatus Omnitrophota bacterium]